MIGWLVLVALGLQSASPGAPALLRMVAAERAFAAATAELGVRDGFLTFFAEDSVQIAAGTNGRTAAVTPARAALASQPITPLPLTNRLEWAPFTGQVSSDGTLGWLTGAYAVWTRAEPVTRLAQGAYFSVWVRQSDGTWKVWLDEGIALPDLWDASPLFRASPDPDAWTAGDPDETMAEAERAVQSGGGAWRDRLSSAVRVHRDAVMPIAGRDRAAEWAARTWQSVAFSVVLTRVAESGDLGIAIGGYDAVTAAGPEHGTWVRVWKRDMTGRWRIVFETSKAGS